MWNFARIRLGGSLWVMRFRPMRSGIDLCCRERNWESHGNASYEDYQRLSEHLRTLTEKIICMSRGLYAQPIYLLCGVPTLTRAWTGDEPAGASAIRPGVPWHEIAQ